jgi:hypothetical protein
LRSGGRLLAPSGKHEAEPTLQKEHRGAQDGVEHFDENGQHSDVMMLAEIPVVSWQKYRKETVGTPKARLRSDSQGRVVNVEIGPVLVDQLAIERG